MPAIGVGTVHFAEQTKYKVQKTLIAAKFNGFALNEKKFDLSQDSKRPEFLAVNPTGIVPFLETDTGCIFSSNAIARFVAKSRRDTSLYGKCFDHEGQIDTWLEFCTHELEVPLMTWVYPTLGLMQDVPQATTEAKKDVMAALRSLEECLSKSTFLIGDFVTLADIALVCALREGFVRVFDPEFRKPFPKVCAWFHACCAMPQFEVVLGCVELCKEVAKPIKPKFSPPAREAVKAGVTETKKAAEPKGTPALGKEAKKEKKAETPASAGENFDVQVTAVGDQIRLLKEKLKGEGVSGKKVNEHAEVKALVAKLQDLKQRASGASTPSSPAVKPADTPKSPAVAPAPEPATASDDVGAQVTAVGDEIRLLKEKLKGEGLSGKKLNEHPEVKQLVAKLQELKAKA
eukprot:TRINITY_DN5531_c0_g1_i1.p1 TRINITY_DN5531_c0_g1~~TRINITY_DN5531_c0_g1_i1.p1  ORF type:complete len:424 (-),score=90.98 TRINITY_DN5531_c0_g1_i1:204-1412(-)